MSRSTPQSGRDDESKTVHELLDELEDQVDDTLSENSLETVPFRKVVFRMAGFAPTTTFQMGIPS